MGQGRAGHLCLSAQVEEAEARVGSELGGLPLEDNAIHGAVGPAEAPYAGPTWAAQRQSAGSERQQRREGAGVD